MSSTYISCYNTQWSGCGLAIVNYKKSLSSYIFYSTFTADFIFPSTYYYFLLLFISNSFSVFFLFISVSKFRSTAQEFFSLCLSVASISRSLSLSLALSFPFLSISFLLPYCLSSVHLFIKSRSHLCSNINFFFTIHLVFSFQLRDLKQPRWTQCDQMIEYNVFS